MPQYVPWKFRKFISLIHENIKATENRNFSILNSRAPSQNNKTSRTSCRCLFETFLPSTPREITFKVSFNLSRS